jgi:hypothetical protein
MANKENINKLLEQVVEDVASILAKSEQPLTKADPGKETTGESTPSGSSSEGSTDPSASPAPTPTASAAGDADDAKPTPDASASPDASAQDPAADQSADPAALKAEYAKMPVDEMKLHFVALHAALMEAMASTGDQSAAAPQAPQATAPEATPGEGSSAGPGEQSVVKKEIKASEGSGGQMTTGMKKTEISFEDRLVSLEKSLKEKDELIADKEKSFAELENKFNEAAASMNKFLQKHTGIGLRKSIAGVSEVAFENKPGTEIKGELVELKKSEAIAKLNEVTRRTDLKKSDREAINQYVLGAAPQSTIAHLLKQ